MILNDYSTDTDPRTRSSWCINDPVIRLREWAGERAYGLPDPPITSKIGSASTCQVRLTDASGLLSREHAQITPCVGGWKIRDLASKNGLWCDGVRRTAFALRPGLEITIGGLRLVAESLQFAALRAVVCRFLGWSEDRQREVDDALHSLRDWAALRSTLVVIGEGDLRPVVEHLHGLTLGSSAPFVEHELGDDLADSVQAAMQGTLCAAVRRQTEADDLVEMLRGMAQPARPRLVLCASRTAEIGDAAIKLGRSTVITVPPLATRKDELERMVQEFAVEAARALGAPTTGFTMHDLERLKTLEFKSFAEVTETVRRIIAIRTWGVTAGAARLGITHVSLSQWARRSNRKLST
jgi:Inner membrane component of T3SS, cytoplasmic domain